MNKMSEILTIAILIIAILVTLGTAGMEYHNRNVIGAMPDETYYEIVRKLGKGCGDGAIVREYEANREYYDFRMGYDTTLTMTP